MRPLSIGEILDRTVTLYVQNFVPLTLIMLCLLIPMSVAQYYSTENSAASYAALLRAISNTATGHKARDANVDKALMSSPPLNAGIVATLVFAIFATPFANIAIAVAVAALYHKRPVRIGEAYRTALSRWPQVLLMILLELLAFVVCAVAGGLTLSVLLLVAILAAKTLPALAIILAVIAFFAAFVWLLLFIMVFLASTFGFYAIGIERLSAGRAFGQGLVRIFNRMQFKRAVLLSLAFLAIQMGIVVLGTVGEAAILLVLKNRLLEVVFSTLFSMVFAAFAAVLIAIYYYDVRTRLEGLDLRVPSEV